jgi:hypothetical protein
MSLLASRLRLVLAASLLAAPRVAHAADSAAAQALFEEGKRLMGAEQFSAACAKFEESQRLDPGVGTLFNLADCHERVGRTASAWGEFTEVAALSKTAGQTAREDVARQRAAALEPKLNRVLVRAPSPAPGLEIRRDESVVGAGQLGARLPIDPGEHTFRASAPGKKPWSSTVTVAPGTPLVVVEIPPLVDAPSPDPTGASPPADGSSQRTLGFVAGGVGVAAWIVGTSAAIVSMSKKSASNDANDGGCDDSNFCNTSKGVEQRDGAITAGNVATVGFVAGAVLGAAGLVLVLTAPRSQAQTGPRIGVAITGTRIGIGGSW